MTAPSASESAAADASASAAATAAAAPKLASSDDVLFQSLFNSAMKTTGAKWADSDATFQEVLAAANKDMDAVDVCRLADTFQQHAVAKMVSGKALFLIEAPTSKPKILSSFLDHVSKIIKKARASSDSHFLGALRPPACRRRLSGTRFSFLSAPSCSLRLLCRRSLRNCSPQTRFTSCKSTLVPSRKQMQNSPMLSSLRGQEVVPLASRPLFML